MFLLSAVLSADAWLIKDSRSDGKIFLPPEYGKALQLASLELQNFLEQMSGARLPFAWGARGRSESGIVLEVRQEAEWKGKESPQAFTIETQERPYPLVTIRGNTSLAVLYGVYQYLENLGIRFLAPGESGTNIPGTDGIRVVKGKKKISYASSFACNELEKPYSDKFKSMLQEYSYISVREDGGRKLIKDLLNIDVPVVLDPTLLLSADDWSRLLGQEHSHKYKNRKYILVYMLDYAFDPTSIIYNVIQKLQDDTSYKIVSIGNLDKKLANCKIIEEASPIEFIRLFKNAECVVTSSFHGTAFAVNFGKPLFSIANIDTNKDDRQASLLELLELSNCIVTQDTDINNIKLENNKTIKAEQKLESQRKKSLAYLKNALQQYE